MERIFSLLNQVWAEYRKSGITDDIIIIGQVADVLLTIQNGTGLTVFSSTLKADVDLSRIHALLRQAVTQNHNDAGDLFDRYVLFRLDKMLPGGRYPTPRHIVNHILRLVNVESKHTMADFACGTGGFLIHAPVAPDIYRFGIEISPEWVNIAIANAKLHGLDLSIRAGNAFRVLIKNGDQTFDRVVMNPPFGENIDTTLAEKNTNYPIGSNSETAFAALALKSLAAGGTAAVLVPSGVLQNNSRGEKELRQRILDHYTLNAVITYPKDAFQPYSALTTHLLVVYNQPPHPDTLIWFFKVMNDGYGTGRGRDLTQEPQSQNDLIMVEEIYRLANQLDAHGTEPIKVVKSDNDVFLIRATSNSRILSVRSYQMPDQADPLILINTQSQDAQCIWRLLLTSTELVLVKQDLETYIKETYHPNKSAGEPPKPITLFQNQVWNEDSLGDVIAFDRSGKRLFGVAVPQGTLRQRFYSLDPDQYIKAPIEEVALTSPELLLQGIRENQRILSNRIENLIGFVISAYQEDELPSPIALNDQSLMGLFDEEQQAIWEKVRSFGKEVIGRENFSIVTSSYFTDRDLISEDRVDKTKSILAALKIFEQMGLIVKVTLKNPLTNDSMLFYRIAEERDIWKQETEVAIEGGEE